MFIIYVLFTCLLCPQSNASGSFLQTYINFVDQRLNFSHFEGSIILYAKVKFPWYLEVASLRTVQSLLYLTQNNPIYRNITIDFCNIPSKLLDLKYM